MVFPVVMYGCESWTIKKAECQRTDAFELWCWRRLLRVPWTARRSNQSILKEISPEYSLKDWCWSWCSSTLAIWCEELTHWKRPWSWERLKAGGEGDDRGRDGWMASLTWWTWVWASSGSWWWTEEAWCCSPRGHKESDTTEPLNWTDRNGRLKSLTVSKLTDSSPPPKLTEEWNGRGKAINWILDYREHLWPRKDLLNLQSFYSQAGL